ncbi:hypothetical protein BRD02_10585 [Halobacteriales archaeon QS_8_69_73]|nr:MAG: hypothetical protein BRD02_10585 [Halobacteriales archaeon QS_8_69_73]
MANLGGSWGTDRTLPVRKVISDGNQYSPERMDRESFRFDDVFADNTVDGTAVRREAERFLIRWSADDIAAVTARTRRLAALGVVGLLAATLLPTTTAVADLLLQVVYYTLVVEVGAMGAIYYLLRDVDRPTELLEADLGWAGTAGLLALVALAYAATNARSGRVVWRFAFKSAPFAPGGRPPPLAADRESLVAWGRRLAGVAAVVVAADVTWTLLTRTDAGTVLAGLLDRAGGVDPRPVVTPLEAGVLYATLFVVGVLLAVALSARR